ncbi:MAG: dicarboxylate/amino acid:cation symporter, partial [Candidatus ainarchaeum sp.]|nr:dicarboxylate/amino acid:cation symporter [Candidatus ainarchaeum sp.]
MPSKLKQPIELLHPESLKRLSAKLQHLINKKLWLKVLIALFIGVIVGLFINPTSGFFEKEIAFIIGEWLALPGTIFLALIQMIVIPLIFASIIRGIASSENINQLKKSGLFIGIYFISTTIIAVLIGLILVYLIQPGNFVVLENNIVNEVSMLSVEEIPINLQNIPSIIVQVIPTNIFSAFLNLQFFQIVIFSIIFGLALVNMDVKQSKPLIDLLGSLQNACIIIVKWAMLIVPFAVFGFMARATIQFGFDILLGMTFYLITVILGLFLIIIFYLMLIYFVAKKNPLIFLKKIRDVQLLAFSTSSSAVVMPISMKVAEEKLGIRSSISNFVIPMGTTINMDGTALYQTVAIVFLAQVFGVALTLPSLILIIITVVGASIGAPGTP